MATMKPFKQWLTEITNGTAGIAVRGLGNVTGDPAGSISAYAARNAAEAPKPFMNTVDSVVGYEGGDTEDQILNKKKKK
jgi:hypothetical protein